MMQEAEKTEAQWIATVQSVRDCNDAIEVQVRYRADHSTENFYLSLEEYAQKPLRKNETLSTEQIQEMRRQTVFVNAYRKCLKKIAVSDKTVSEIQQFLQRGKTLSDAEIQTILQQLKELGYLDDQRYLREHIRSLRALEYGRNRIGRTLRAKGINEKDLQQALGEIDETEEIEQGEKLARRLIASWRAQPLAAQKKMLRHKLVQAGYTFDEIDTMINHLDFASDADARDALLRKKVQQAWKRYSHRYSGFKRKQNVYNYLSRQGFDIDDIRIAVEEMENEDESK